MRKRLYSAMPCGGWRAGKRLITHWDNTSNTRCRSGILRLGEKRISFQLILPAPCGQSCGRRIVDDGLLHFACYVAVCYTVYGASYDSLTTEHILGLVSQLRPDMVKQLKTAGSGKLPKDIQRRKTEHFTASANDAFCHHPHHRQGLHRGVLC